MQQLLENGVHQRDRSGSTRLVAELCPGMLKTPRGPEEKGHHAKKTASQAQEKFLSQMTHAQVIFS